MEKEEKECLPPQTRKQDTAQIPEKQAHMLAQPSPTAPLHCMHYPMVSLLPTDWYGIIAPLSLPPNSEQTSPTNSATLSAACMLYDDNQHVPSRRRKISTNPSEALNRSKVANKKKSFSARIYLMYAARQALIDTCSFALHCM